MDVSQGRFEGLIERLRSHPSVEMYGLWPFDQLVAEYCCAGVALDVMERNAERELAFPTRTVIYMWCGLPVIHSDYTDLARLIERFDAGWLCDPDDTRLLALVVEEILRDPRIVAEKGRNARRLVAERLMWDQTIEPLAAWCRNPRERPNKLTVALQDVARQRRLVELEEELAAARRDLDALRGKMIFRLVQKRRFLGPLLAPFTLLLSVVIAVFLFFALWLTRGSSKQQV
jgi:hypothetical protein